MKLRVKSKRDEENNIDDITRKAIYTKEDEEKMYVAAREYIYKHQGCTAMTVSLATGIPRNVIETFVREGRFKTKS